MIWVNFFICWQTVDLHKKKKKYVIMIEEDDLEAWQNTTSIKGFGTSEQKKETKRRIFSGNNWTNSSTSGNATFGWVS